MYSLGPRVIYSPQPPVDNQTPSDEAVFLARQIISGRLEPYQRIQAGDFFRGLYEQFGDNNIFSSALQFFTGMIEDGMSYEISFQAAKDLCKWLNEGKSHDESVVLVAEKLNFQTPEVVRILISRFLSDMMTSGDDPEDTRAQKNAKIDNLARYFFQECNMGFEQRWPLVQKLLTVTEGINFDDRAEIVFFAMITFKTCSIEHTFIAVSAVCDLVRVGVSFDEATKLLDKSQEKLKKPEVNNATAA